MKIKKRTKALAKAVREDNLVKVDLEELKRRIENQRWYDTVYWWIRHGIWQRLSEIPLIIKSFFQRGYRGWSNADTWGFDCYLSKVIYEGLVHLKKYKQGNPIVLKINKNNEDWTDEDYKNNENMWHEILDKMIYAFNLANEIGKGNREHYLSKLSKESQKEFNCLTKEEDKVMREGMALFIKYYFNLWD